jgi:serine protease Do
VNRVASGVLATLILAASAAAQDDPVKALEKRVQETARKVSAAFVFFGGGSGVLISEDGWILTNHHVIAAPAMGPVQPDLPPKVEVNLQDAKRRFAEIRCSDPVGDIALLKMERAEGEKFPFITFGDSDKIEVGQQVLAIGAPFGIGARTDPAPDGRHYPSVSLGIVSAVHRFQQQYGDCIQTDAAVNPGNSGGPLVDLDGKLLGINGRILTRYMNRVNSGVGFAIPANQIRNFLPKMKEGGTDRRIYHGRVDGLVLDDQTNERGENLVTVRDVRRNTAAADAGFKQGDAVLAVNSLKVFSRYRFFGIVSTWPAESEVTVTVRRDDKTIGIKVALESTQERAITGELTKPPQKGRGSTGATFFDEKPGKDGLVTVEFVESLGPADEAGLLQGDVVLKVDGEVVKNRKTILERVQSRKPGDTVTLRVRREGEEFDVKIKLGRLSDQE